jgi:hypothetical protein
MDMHHLLDPICSRADQQRREQEQLESTLGKIDELIERHTKKLERVRTKLLAHRRESVDRNATRDVLAPFMQALAPHFGAQAVIGILGPFGLGARYSLSFHEGHADGPLLGYLEVSVRSAPTRIHRVDRSNNQPLYPHGSIGALNGFNFPEIEITPEVTLEQVASWFRQAVDSEGTST